MRLGVEMELKVWMWGTWVGYDEETWGAQKVDRSLLHMSPSALVK